MLPSEMGATQGSRISSRTSHFPRNLRSRAMARMLARTMTSVCDTSEKMAVFPSALRNAGSSRAALKFSSPTKRGVEVPMVTLEKL
jgi:hypothetical protein